MGACHGKSALGVGDTPATKKPHKHKRNKHNGNGSLKKASKSCIYTYPVDVPVLVQDVHQRSEKSKGNGHVIHQELNCRSRSSAEEPKTDDHDDDEVFESCDPDFPSYGPDCTRPESCDPDTPQPHDQDSAESCDPNSQLSCDIDSPVSCDQHTIPASDSGIYSVSQCSHEAMPAVYYPQCETMIEGEITSGNNAFDKIDTSTPQTSPAKNTRSESHSMGSLDNISDAAKVMPPTNLPVKRFLVHQGLPPARPQSESRFSFKHLRKQKAVSGIEKRSVNRRSWKSQDSFDITSEMRTGMSLAGSQCSDMCICDELYNIHAPLAQFDSILTMDSPSCGSLHGLPEADSVENGPVGESTNQTGSSRNIHFTCSVCKKRMTGQTSVIEHPCVRPCGHSQRNSRLSSSGSRNSRCDESETDLAMLDLSDDPIPVTIDEHEMLIIDAQTYNQLMSDLSVVRLKLQRIYNLLLQEEFDSISDIINSSGLETCFLEA